MTFSIFYRGAKNKSTILMDFIGNSSVSKPVLRCLFSSITEANSYFIKKF